MPPWIALLLTVILIIYAFRVDSQRNDDISVAIWIPFCWMAIIGTRYISQWFNMGGALKTPDEYLDGSPVDRAVFLVLYAAALYVLLQRRISIRNFMSHNAWLSVFLIYCMISTVWSDYPSTALKRWTKVVEHVVMVLVVLSERNTTQAIDALFRRFAYFCLPLSVLFLKYFPELGRSFDQWTGRAINTGVTMDKNALGHICVLTGVYFIATFVSKKDKQSNNSCAKVWFLDGLMFFFCIWLLSIADAKTSLVCFCIGAVLVVALTTSNLRNNPKRLTYYLVAGIVAIVVFQSGYDIRDTVIQGLNRDSTLTDRTEVWADVLAMENNPIIGTGFESFWLGTRAQALWDKYWWQPNQAHNGYIETYINLGIIGLILLSVMIVTGYIKAQKSFMIDPYYSRIRFGLLLPIVIFNYTDATFKALHILYFVFFLIVIDFPCEQKRWAPA